MDSSGLGKGFGDALMMLVYFVIASLIVIPIMLIVIGSIWLYEPDYKQEAIDRGYAEYCSQTGEWAWKGECE